MKRDDSPPNTYTPVTPDWRVEVERLAKLPLIEYERERGPAAEKLGCRVKLLDAEVIRARGGGESPDSIKGLALSDPEPWQEPVSGAALLSGLAETFRRFAILPKHADIVLALWTLFTYVYNAGECCPLLVINSPEKGCGKTTVLGVIGRLCARPLFTSNITPAALFRVVEAARPTLLIDEADSFAAENEELRGVMNSGHTRSGAFVIRTVGDDHEPCQFSTWCPKALAGIDRLPGTIEDRAIIVSLQRKGPGEQVERLRAREHLEDWRRKAARWGEDHFAALASASPSLPDFLQNRKADNWEPLLAIAEAAGGQWPRLAVEAARALTRSGEDTSTGTELLLDIRAAFATSGRDRFSSAGLIEAISADEAAKWNEYRNGKPLTPTQLARLLKRFHIGPKTLRLPSGEQAKGYQADQFTDAFRRYLTPDRTLENNVPPSQQSQTPGETTANSHPLPFTGAQSGKPTPERDAGTAGTAVTGEQAEETTEDEKIYGPGVWMKGG